MPDIDGDETNVVQAFEVGADIGVAANEDAEPKVDYLVEHPLENAAEVDSEEIEADIAMGVMPGIGGVALNPS